MGPVRQLRVVEDIAAAESTRNLVLGRPMLFFQIDHLGQVIRVFLHHQQIFAFFKKLTGFNLVGWFEMLLFEH